MKTRTQFFLSLFLSFLWLCPTGVQAEEPQAAVEVGDEFVDEEGGVSYIVTGTEEGGNTVAVTGFTEAVSSGAVVIPATVTHKEASYAVTRVGIVDGDVEDPADFALDGLEYVKSVVFPTSLVSIGEGAFAGATTLTSATLKAEGSETTTALVSVGKDAFKNTGLTSVTFENATSLVTIGEGAFKGCGSLSSVVLTGATKLATIGANAFYGIALETVDLSWFTGLKTIGEGAFADSKVKNLWLPESLESIGEGAFADCTSLTEAEFRQGNAGGAGNGSSLDSIGKDAFKGCTSLASVTLTGATSLTKIGEGAFENCTALASVELTEADNLASIGANAFKGIALETVDLSWFTELKTIGAGAFAGSKAEKLWLPKSLVTVGEGAFAGCTALKEALVKESGAGGGMETGGDASDLASIGKDAFKGCTSLETVVLRNAISLTEVGESAFNGCTELKTIWISEAVALTEIGDSAFAGIAMEKLDLTAGTAAGAGAGAVNLTKIGEGAFAESKLTSVVLPEKLAEIGAGAFADCEELASVMLTSPVPPTVGEGAFAGAGDEGGCEFTVGGEASLGAYLADGDWAEKFADEEAEEYETEDGFKFIVVGEDDGREAIIVGYTVKEVNNGENENEVEDEEGFKLQIPEVVTVDEDEENDGIPVTTIGIGAFASVTGLTEVSFPESVTAIGDRAFKGLKGLTVVTFTSATPPTVAADAFEGISTSPDRSFRCDVPYDQEQSEEENEEASHAAWLAYMNAPVLGDFFTDYYLSFDQDGETNAYTLTKVVMKESVEKRVIIIPETLQGSDEEYYPVVAVKKSAFTDITSPAYISFVFEATTPPALIPEEGEEEDKEIPDGIEFSCPDEALFAYRTSDDWWPYFQPTYDFTFTTSDEKGTSEEEDNEETGDGDDDDNEEVEEPTEKPTEEPAEVEPTATVTGLEEEVTAAELSDITIPETVFKGGKAYTLVAIADGAFAECTGLKTFTLESTTPPALGEGVFAAGVTAKTCVFDCPDGALADYRKDPKWAVYFPTPEPEPSEPSEPSVPGGGSGVNGGFRVAFYDVDGTLLSQTTIAKGDTVPADKVPALEAREGYTLVWYAGRYETNIWDFSSPVTAVLELHALWVEDEDEGEETGVAAVIGGGNGAVVLYNLRGQLVRKAIVTRATSPATLRKDLGVPSGIYILTTPEGSRKVKL